MDIDAFLDKLKIKLNIFGYEFSRERTENRETMKELGISMHNVKDFLSELRKEDYSEGPKNDQEEGGEYWVFGKEIYNKEVYIKLNLGKESRKVVCYSFHIAKSKMKLPNKEINKKTK